MMKKNKQKKEGVLASTSLQFFGQMSASATHEIKNSLAIINENAGLLQDLTLMSKNGQALSPDRIVNITQKIENHVKQADGIIKKLNRFSHSSDQFEQMADLEKTVSFVLQVASRLIEMAGTDIKVESKGQSVQVETNLFFLQALIWRAIEPICRDTKFSTQITISFDENAATPGIWFLMDQMDEKIMESLLTSEDDLILMGQLGVSILKNIETKSFGLHWSKTV